MASNKKKTVSKDTEEARASKVEKGIDKAEDALENAALEIVISESDDPIDKNPQSDGEFVGNKQTDKAADDAIGAKVNKGNSRLRHTSRDNPVSQTNPETEIESVVTDNATDNAKGLSKGMPDNKDQDFPVMDLRADASRSLVGKGKPQQVISGDKSKSADTRQEPTLRRVKADNIESHAQTSDDTETANDEGQAKEKSAITEDLISSDATEQAEFYIEEEKKPAEWTVGQAKDAQSDQQLRDHVQSGIILRNDSAEVGRSSKSKGKTSRFGLKGKQKGQSKDLDKQQDKASKKSRLKLKRSGKQVGTNERIRKQKRVGVWGWVKRFYMFIAGIVFFLACCVIAFVAAKPWLESWMVNEPPAITLPSKENLHAMPKEERLKLRDSAMRLAPFNQKTLTSDPIPFEGGRPNELSLFRIRPVADGVKVIGKMRLYEMPDKRQFLRFTDFEITAGYDLRILLAAHANPRSKANLEDEGYVDLAPLKGEIGPQNYLLPKSPELSDFGSVVIYDQLFEVIYAVSKL